MAVRVDRDRAARLGITMQAVVNALYDAYGQRQISTIYGQSNQYRVVLEASDRIRTDASAIGQLRITGGTGQVPLAEIASITRTNGPLLVTRENQFPAVTLSFNLTPGHALSDAVEAVRQAERRAGHARHRHRPLRRRCGGVRHRPGRAALADPGGGGGDLPGAGHALRELHPPHHHPLHAALGRHRRPAGAGDSPGWTCRWWG
jgi:hypothetical protein